MPRSAAAEIADWDPGRAVSIERYRDHWVHHLAGIADALSRRVIGRLEQTCGYVRLRPSLGPFLSLVWREPRPLMELAQQLSVSRQACSKVARLAEQDGYVAIGRREGDRTQRVRLTARGRKLVDDSVRLLLEEEAALAERVGADRLGRLVDATSRLFYGMGLQDQTDAGLGEMVRRSMGILPIVAGRIEEELHERVRAKGHDGLQRSHAKLIALIGDDEMSVSEMARLQGVSRQATGATVHSLETLGYVRRDPHATDGRAVHVRLTEAGVALIQDSLAALDELEERFRGILGVRRFVALRSVAAELHGMQALEEELFTGQGSVSPSAGAPEDPAHDDRALRSIAAFLERRLGSGAANRLGRFLCHEGSAAGGSG